MLGLTSDAGGLCKPNISVNITKRIKKNGFYDLPQYSTTKGNEPESVASTKHWMLKIKNSN